MKAIVTTSEVKEFVQLIARGVECWARAGEIAAKAIAANPDWIDEVCAAEPMLTPQFVRKFERIGLRQLHPKAMIGEAPGVRKLRKLPYALQVKYLSEPVPVLIHGREGWETLGVDVWNLAESQAAQVFDRDGIRTEAAQRAWLAARDAERPAPIVAEAPYRVLPRGKVFFTGPCTMDRKELARILSQLD